MKLLIQISKFVIIVACIFLSFSDVKSQVTLDRMIWNVSNLQGNSLDNVYWQMSIGQPYTTTIATHNFGLTQGFHQPAIINCPGDLDNNGMINTTDLLIFISAFNSFSLNADLNGDSFVGVSDLILFITMLGTSCSN